MSETKAKSHAVAWTLALLALPLLYLLSFPPLSQCLILTNRGDSWLASYSAPYRWLEKRTPLKTALHGYDKWWQHVTGYDKRYMGFGRKFTQ